MCTSRSADEIVVCDVAVADVAAALAPLAGVELTHLPFEGTSVRNTELAQRDRFRELVGEAIARHGGSL